MSENDVEVFHLNGKWRVRIAGRQILPGEYDTEAAAVGAAREHARESVIEPTVPPIRAARAPRLTPTITVPGLYLG